MGFVCFVEWPMKGSHIHPLVTVNDKLALGVETFLAPAPEKDLRIT